MMGLFSEFFGNTFALRYTNYLNYVILCFELELDRNLNATRERAL